MRRVCVVAPKSEQRYSYPVSRSRINPISRESRHVPDVASEQDEASPDDGVHHESSLEEQYRAVRDAMPREADIVELERESRESVDDDLPYKRKFDPVFGYFADRMGIDPHDVAFYYELSVRSKDGGENTESFRQHFTNLHDLQEAMRQQSDNGISTVAMHLPQDFLARLQPGGDLQKFNDGFGIVRGQLEKDTLNITDKYAEAATSGGLARLKEKDAEKRGDATGHRQAVAEELVRQDVAEQIKSAASEQETSPEQRERELRSDLNLRRSVYVGGENAMRTWEKKNKWFWDRRKLERSVKRAALASVLHPGDAEVPTRAGASTDALQDVAERENIFRDRLREQGITKEADIRQIYTLEQHKIEYEYARTALAMHLKKTETERFADGDVGAEHAKEFARANVYDELFVRESLTLNRMRLEAWPAAEKGKARRAWERYRAWYGKLGKWGRVGAGVTVAVGIGGTAAALGTWTAGAAAGYVGVRTVGSLAGIFGGALTGEGAARMFSWETKGELQRLDARERILKEKVRGLEVIDPAAAAKILAELSREHQSIMDARYGIAKRKALVRAGAAAVGGFVLGAGTSYHFAHATGLDTLMSAKPTTEQTPAGSKLSTGAVHEVTPAPKPSVVETADTRPAPEPAHTPEAVPSPETAAERMRAIPRAGVEQPPVGAQLEELATVKKGEGAWGPVRRQLRAQLTAHPDQFGLKPEDLQNGAKVQHALNSRTTQILKDLGFIGPKGTTQIGIHPPGTKIILESNGGLRIEGGSAYDYGAHPRGMSAAESLSGSKGDTIQNIEPEHAPAPETVVHHEPAPVEPLRVVPEPPVTEHVAASVSESPASPEPIRLTKLADVLEPSEPKVPTVAEVAVAAQETAAIRSAIVQEATAHYADRFNELSPLGKECFVHGVQRHIELSGGRMSPAEVLREPDMFRMDFELAKTIGAISPEELSALEQLGFTKDSLFTVNLRGDYGYAATIRDMRVVDFVKNLTAEGGGVDTGKLEKVVNFFMPGGRGSALVIGKHHLALTEKLSGYLSHGGKPDMTVAEALIAP